MGLFCFEKDRDLSRFLDGELPLNDHRRMQEHLRGCPRCSRRLNEFRSVDQWLRTGPEGGGLRSAPTRVVVAAAVAAALAASLAANLFLAAGGSPRGAFFRLADGPSDALNRLYARLSEPEADR
jgi:anti-sigma factor RsiW